MLIFRRRGIRKLMIALAVLSLFSVSAEANGGKNVPRIPKMNGFPTYVYTDDSGTLEQVFADKIILRSGAVRVPELKVAQFVLAIIRSSAQEPLDSSYESFRKLEDAMEDACKANCPTGHIYVFNIGPDGSMKMVYHNVFDWSTTNNM